MIDTETPPQIKTSPMRGWGAPIAKINLGLNVISKRPDGYHDLETVFFPVPIHEELSIEPLQGSDKPYTLTIVYPDGTSDDGSALCQPEKNLVVKAYMLLREHFNHPSMQKGRTALPPVHITLHKQLPSQAGMGAGSSDAAFMIRLLNEQYSLGMSVEEMQRCAAKIGADCAFFITCQPSYATGIGDILQPLPDGVPALRGKYLALVKPDCAVSTKEAYAGIHPRATLSSAPAQGYVLDPVLDSSAVKHDLALYPAFSNPDHVLDSSAVKLRKNCLDVILHQPIETWHSDLTNDFEDSIFPKLPVLADIKQTLYDHGALYAAMSGSGSTIFGIFDDATLNLQALYPHYYTKMLKL